ncbi:MAG: recombinase family protein [archaeon]
MKKVVIYTRISTYEQHLESQIDDLVEFCKDKNYEVANIYADTITGASIQADRQQFAEMDLFLSENQDVTDVFVWEISRLGRSLLNTYQIIQDYKQRGINIYFKKEALNTLKTTHDDELRLNILASIAEYERSQIKERTKRGTLNSVKKGGGLKGAYIQFGYQKDENKRLIINTDEAEIIKQIFDLYVNKNYSTIEIANYLNSNKIKTKTKKLKEDGKLNIKSSRLKKNKSGWTNNHISNLLRKKILIGYREFKDIELGYNKNLHIIDNELFNKAQKKLTDNKFKQPNFQKYEHIFKGKIKDDTGLNLNMIKAKKGTETYYKNDNMYVNANMVNNAVYFYLKSAVRDNKKINDKILTLEEKIKNYKSVNDNYIKTINKEKDKLKALYNDKLNNIIDDDMYLSFNTDINNNIKEQSTKLNKNIEIINNLQKEIEELKKSNEFRFDNPTIFKNYINTIIDKITVEKLNIEKDIWKNLFPDKKRSDIYLLKINTNTYGYYECIINSRHNYMFTVLGSVFDDENKFIGGSYTEVLTEEGETIQSFQSMLLKTPMPNDIKV